MKQMAFPISATVFLVVSIFTPANASPAIARSAAAHEQRPGLCLAQTAAEAKDEFTFRALYHSLWDHTHPAYMLSLAAMSGDGNRLFVAGARKPSKVPVAFWMNSDGSRSVEVGLPDLKKRSILEVAINRDGSRAFFVAGGFGISQLYAVGTGGARLILEIGSPGAKDVNQIIRDIQTTAGGESVYFRDYWDLWRISFGGGKPEKIIDDTAVQRVEGKGVGVGIYAVSDDGSRIAFISSGYADPKTKATIWNDDVMVFDGAGYRQATNDAKNIPKNRVAISGDGSTIAFNWANQLVAMPAATLNKKTTLVNAPSMRLALPYAGDLVFATGGFSGGRMFAAAGGWQLDMFPGWNIGGIAIAITDNFSVSDDGKRIAFRVVYNTAPFEAAFYIGYLDDAAKAYAAAPDAPVISRAWFEPASMPQGDPQATILLLAEIDDPNGFADLMTVQDNEMVAGQLEADLKKLPVVFPTAPADQGTRSDKTKGDGVFTALGKPAGAIGTPVDMTVRISAMDKARNVVLADVALPVTR